MCWLKLEDLKIAIWAQRYRPIFENRRNKEFSPIKKLLKSIPYWAIKVFGLHLSQEFWIPCSQENDGLLESNRD